MDRICGAVLDRIHALSPAGRYVIIAEDEFFEAFPEGCEATYEELNRVLTVLKKGGYIDMKYSRGDMYCVAPLKEYVEELPASSAPAPVCEQRVKRFDFIFVSAFAGSALGSILTAVILALFT